MLYDAGSRSAKFAITIWLRVENSL